MERAAAVRSVDVSGEGAVGDVGLDEVRRRVVFHVDRAAAEAGGGGLRVAGEGGIGEGAGGVGVERDRAAAEAGGGVEGVIFEGAAGDGELTVEDIDGTAPLAGEAVGNHAVFDDQRPAGGCRVEAADEGGTAGVAEAAGQPQAADLGAGEDAEDLHVTGIGDGIGVRVAGDRQLVGTGAAEAEVLGEHQRALCLVEADGRRVARQGEDDDVVVRGVGDGVAQGAGHRFVVEQAGDEEAAGVALQQDGQRAGADVQRGIAGGDRKVGAARLVRREEEVRVDVVVDRLDGGLGGSVGAGEAVAAGTGRGFHEAAEVAEFAFGGGVERDGDFDLADVRDDNKGEGLRPGGRIDEGRGGAEREHRVGVVEQAGRAIDRGDLDLGLVVRDGDRAVVDADGDGDRFAGVHRDAAGSRDIADRPQLGGDFRHGAGDDIGGGEGAVRTGEAALGRIAEQKRDGERLVGIAIENGDR